MTIIGNNNNSYSFFYLDIQWQQTPDVIPLLAIIVKHGVLISKWGGLYYALLKVLMDKIALRKNFIVDN